MSALRHPEYVDLLQAVLDTPADDAPRLVLADWLDEHGEAGWAELIRVQCELTRLRAAGPAASPQAVGLARREDHLLQGGHRWPAAEFLPACPWVATFAQSVLTPEESYAWWDRGFVAGLQLPVWDWISSGDDLIGSRRRGGAFGSLRPQAQPIRVVRFTAEPDVHQRYVVSYPWTEDWVEGRAGRAEAVDLATMDAFALRYPGIRFEVAARSGVAADGSGAQSAPDRPESRAPLDRWGRAQRRSLERAVCRQFVRAYNRSSERWMNREDWDELDRKGLIEPVRRAAAMAEDEQALLRLLGRLRTQDGLRGVLEELGLPAPPESSDPP